MGAETLVCVWYGQYLTICELDYNILQGEIQNIQKTKSAVDIGEFCLVEDLSSARWYRGRVQNRKEDLFDVFLIDHGNVLSVGIDHISSCSNDLFILPPKIVCGFLANMLVFPDSSHSVVENYFSSLIGKNFTGYIQALLPHKILLLEAPDINNDFVRHGFGRYVDTDTFLFLVEMLTEVPLKQNIEPAPDLLIDKPRSQWFCFQPSGLRGYEDILSFSGPRLTCGMHVKVRVTAAVNSGLFYCQMASAETDLLEMSRKLGAVCEYRTKEHSQKETENLGLLCSVQGKDGKWYRGFVQFLPVNSQVRVLFIDYGYFESVSVDNVHRLPPDFYSAPIMAFPCSLSCLSGQDEAVRTQQLSFLKSGLLGGVLVVEISSFDEAQHLYSVTVFGAEDNPIKETEPIEEHPRMKLGSIIETEVSPQGEQLEEENVCKNETEKAQASSLKALSIRPGCEFAVRCSYISSPSDFWCQPLDKGPALEELMNKVQQYYSTHTVPLKSGDLCCITKSPVDGKWYRAFIIEQQKDHARVVLVDYGFTIQIRKQSLQAIMPEYVDLEAQAFRCSLSKTCREWSLKACNILKDFVVKSTCGLKCKVISQLSVKNKGLCNVVDLYDTQTQQRITDMLVEHGLARKATAPTTLSTVFPESFVYSSYDLSPGKEEIVYVTHVSSQWEVYCHLDRNTEIIEELEKKISEESEKIMQASTRAVVRKLCLAKYFDGRWYRGLAHPVQSPLHLSVFFVDYGNTNISEKTHVMFIPRDSVDLLYTPMQAVRCSLASVSKEELYADAKECLDGAVLNKQVRVVIVGKNKDGSFDVQLFDGDVNINEKVNDFILSLSPKPNTGMSCSTSGTEAKHRNTSVKCKSQPKGRPSNPLYVRGTPPRMRENERNTNVHGNRNVRVTQQNRNRTKSCVSATLQKSCDVKEQRETQHPKEPGTPQLTCLPDRKLKADSENATVLSVETNGRFYIRLTKTSDFLAALQSRIADNLYRCETVGKQDVKQGLRCLAEVDNKWHRAVIQKVGRDKCHVFLVDHGITIETSSSSVRRQCCSTKEIPNLAVLCKVTFSEGEDAQRLWDETLKLMIGKEVKLVFVRYSETKNLWMVEIVMNGRFLVHQISDSLQQNQEIIQHSAETQSEAAEEDTSPPQQLVCAPVDIDKSYFGFAAAVTTPFEFCVVLEDLLLIMNKVSVMLDDLPVLMPPLPEAHLTPGSCCLLESDTQEKWCRAEVVGADASLVLNLVDYGHCEYLPYKDHSKLKRLPEALINLPKVTYPCTLRGVKPVGVDGQWTDEAVIFFQQRLCQKNLQIFFREFESDSRWKVDVLADGGHVAKDLVDAGHASYADVMLELRYALICYIFTYVISCLGNEKIFLWEKRLKSQLTKFSGKNESC
uniref:Tudor domain-containing protein n=1 Tax=Anabas testudineus TaxID=64144 RepID=A0A7N6A7L8_ANATE